MSVKNWRRGGITALLVMGLSHPLVASAQEPDGEEAGEAKDTSAYDDLVALAGSEFDEKNYDAALDALERAYAIDDYNMARIKKAKGDLEGALELYEKFAVAPGVDLEYRRETLARIKVLKEAIALTEPAEEEAAPTEEKKASTSGLFEKSDVPTKADEDVKLRKGFLPMK